MTAVSSVTETDFAEKSFLTKSVKYYVAIMRSTAPIAKGLEKTGPSVVAAT